MYYVYIKDHVYDTTHLEYIGNNPLKALKTVMKLEDDEDNGTFFHVELQKSTRQKQDKFERYSKQKMHKPTNFIITEVEKDDLLF